MKIKLLRRVRKTLEIKFINNKVVIFDRENDRIDEYETMNEFLEMIALRWLGIDAMVKYRDKQKRIKLLKKYRELN